MARAIQLSDHSPKLAAWYLPSFLRGQHTIDVNSISDASHDFVGCSWNSKASAKGTGTCPSLNLSSRVMFLRAKAERVGVNWRREGSGKSIL